jgi:isopenicillin N synthase-like dioxygenase
MYLFQPRDKQDLLPLAVPAPTASAGLFIRTRAGRTIQAKIPTDCMAFQTGEALQLLTRNQLQATPHYVAAGSEGPILPTVLQKINEKKKQSSEWNEVTEGTISRETMAVFLQPDVDAVIGPDGETFGQYTRRVLESHYEGTEK